MPLSRCHLGDHFLVEVAPFEHCVPTTNRLSQKFSFQASRDCVCLLYIGLIGYLALETPEVLTSSEKTELRVSASGIDKGQKANAPLEKLDEAPAPSGKTPKLDHGLSSVAHASLVSNQDGEEVVVDSRFARDADQASSLPVKGTPRCVVHTYFHTLQV